MFEIGNALIQARHRLGLELADVERETKLRAYYLRALEQEQFDQLPPGYSRSFLRSYAGFLGLDPDVLVDEYTARYEPHDGPHAPEPLPRPVGRRGRRPGRWVGVVALGVVVVAGLVVAYLVYGRSSTTATSGRRTTTTAQTARQHPRARTTPHHTTTKPTTTSAVTRPVIASVTLAAVTGRCWLFVRKGSAQGPVVYEGTLQPGQSVHLHGSRYWARIGAPPALSLTVDGKAQTLPGRTSNVLIDAHGVTTVP